MSTWISDPVRVKSFAGLAVIALVVAACSSSRLGTMSARSRTTTISVAGKGIAIEGPPGFCVDKQVSQTGGDPAFVLLGNCGVVSPSAGSQQPAVKALLTASVADNKQAVFGVFNSGVKLDRFFRSRKGRRALSRSSNPATVSVLDTFQKDGMFFLRARDTSKGIVPGASQNYWRGYFDLEGEIVSVSVIGFKSKPLPPAKSLATLREFASLIRKRNTGPFPAVPVGQPAALLTPYPVAVAQTETVKPQPIKRPRLRRRSFRSIGLLRKLLNW